MIDCVTYAKETKEYLREDIDENNVPSLAIFTVGNDPASQSYIKGKVKDCEEIGIKCIVYQYDESITEESLIGLIKWFAEKHDGIIVQLPLPKHIDVNHIKDAIHPEKDVDGFRKDSKFTCCTPQGIVDWLIFNGYDLSGKDVVVIGRSEIVGKPLVNLLIDMGATVTCCNSKSHVAKYTKTADVVVSAVGIPKKWKSDMFSSKVDIIIDVGINRVDGKLCGDVDREEVNSVYPNIYITPVPKGVGLLTRVALMVNVCSTKV